MHKSSILRMKWFADNYASKIIGNKIKVLDVGSSDFNGSYKHLFGEDKYEYFGLDMEKGPNVDIILKNPYNWKEIETDSFDIVISGQAFEHIEFFWITMSEMGWVLKKNGLVCIIAPNGFGEHRYPVDCYRFFSDGMVALARYVSLDTLHASTNCAPINKSKEWNSENFADSILIAQKKYEGNVKYVNIDSYQCIPANQEIFRSSLIPYKPKSEPINTLIKRIKRFVKKH